MKMNVLTVRRRIGMLFQTPMLFDGKCILERKSTLTKTRALITFLLDGSDNLYCTHINKF